MRIRLVAVIEAMLVWVVLLLIAPLWIAVAFFAFAGYCTKKRP